MNEEELDENEPIDPNDPEKGLDKFVKRNQERRQKEFDEAKYGNEELRRRANKNLTDDQIREKIRKEDEQRAKEGNLPSSLPREKRKQQQDMEEGNFLQDPEEENSFRDPNSGFRTTLAIGTEVLGNTFLDLFSADPTQLTQFFGAQGINAIAQRIRGGEFSKGEMRAAGIASLLPGGAQARSLGGTITRTALRGGVSGAIETGAADLIDTGEIDPERVAAGFGVGTAFGGLFGVAAGQKDIKKFFSRLRARMGSNLDPEQAVFTPEELASMGIGQPMAFAKVNPKGSGDPEGLRSLKYQEGDILANTPTKNVKLLKDLNLTDDQSVFLLSNYYKEGSVTSTTISRDQAAAIESLYTTVEEFDKTKDLALPYFLKGMKGIKRDKTPQLDHIAQLKAALPFFNNAKVSQFPEITKIILEEGVFGLGHQRGNFKYLEFDVHTVKSNYFEDIVGNNGEIFFKNKDISTPKKLREAAKEFADIINTSNNVVADAIEQYKFMNKIDINETELDEFVNILSKQPIRRKYSIKQVKEIFKQMEEDGFMRTPKESLKAEQAEVRSEIKEAQAKAKQQERLDKDASSVEKRVEVINKFINQDPEKYQKTSFAFGMKDEDLRELAEEKYNELRRNRLIREDIQDDFFEAPKKREEAIKLIMKSILNQQRRSSK